MSEIKNWYQSKTVWAGILQAVAGLIGAIALYLTNSNYESLVAAILISIKGFFEI